MDKSIFNDAKRVLSIMQGRQWGHVDLDDAAIILTTKSLEYLEDSPGTGLRGEFEIERHLPDFFRENSIIPTRMNIPVEAINEDEAYKDKLLSVIIISVEAAYARDPKKRAYADVAYCNEEDSDYLVAADHTQIDFSKIIEKVDFFARAISAPDALKEITYDGQQWVFPNPERKETDLISQLNLISQLMIGAGKSIYCRIHDGVVVPVEKDVRTAADTNQWMWLALADVRDPHGVAEQMLTAQANFSREDRGEMDRLFGKPIRIYGRDTALSCLHSLGLKISARERE